MAAMFALASLVMGVAPATAQQKAPAQQKAQKNAAQSGNSAVGTWTGPVTQVGKPKPFSLAMTVHQNGGDTDYPELGCGGRLTRVGVAGGYTFFLETITRGRLDKGGQCIDGSITVSTAGDQLAWGWFGNFKGQTIVAYGTLARR